MGVPTAEKSQGALAPLSDAEVQEARENLVRCLDGLDQKGEAGLQEALDRIYPTTGLVRKPMGGPFSSSYALHDANNLYPVQTRSYESLSPDERNPRR